MLYAEMTYLDETESFQTVQIQNIMECDIDEISITGFSFWQTEGGTAKLKCPVFPELAEVLEQQTIDYFTAEFTIYESDTLEHPVFLGYLKRGNYEYETESAINVKQDSIVSLTLHDPISVIAEKLTDDFPFPTVWIAQGAQCEINYWLPRLIRHILDTLTYPVGKPFLQTINFINEYNPVLTNPMFVSDLRIWNESDYILPRQPSVAAVDTRQFKVETIGAKDYFTYFRRLKDSFLGGGTLNGFVSVRRVKYEIAGSVLVLLPYESFYEEKTWALGGNNDEEFWATGDWITEIDSPSSPNIFDLTGDRKLKVSGTTSWVADYTGNKSYTHVIFDQYISIPEILKGLLRVNLSCLTCKYNTIAISNKIVDNTSFIDVDNPVFAYPTVSSNQYINDVITESDLPFVNAEQIALGINNYFKDLMKSQLTVEIGMEVDLNPLSDEITYPLEVGKGYHVDNYFIYVTNIKIDYDSRTAKLKGIGRLA